MEDDMEINFDKEKNQNLLFLAKMIIDELSMNIEVESEDMLFDDKFYIDIVRFISKENFEIYPGVSKAEKKRSLTQLIAFLSGILEMELQHIDPHLIIDCQDKDSVRYFLTLLLELIQILKKLEKNTEEEDESKSNLHEDYLPHVKEDLDQFFNSHDLSKLNKTEPMILSHPDENQNKLRQNYSENDIGNFSKVHWFGSQAYDVECKNSKSSNRITRLSDNITTHNPESVSLISNINKSLDHDASEKILKKKDNDIDPISFSGTPIPNAKAQHESISNTSIAGKQKISSSLTFDLAMDSLNFNAELPLSDYAIKNEIKKEIIKIYGINEYQKLTYNKNFNEILNSIVKRLKQIKLSYEKFSKDMPLDNVCITKEFFLHNQSDIDNLIRVYIRENERLGKLINKIACAMGKNTEVIRQILEMDFKITEREILIKQSKIAEAKKRSKKDLERCKEIFVKGLKLERENYFNEIYGIEECHCQKEKQLIDIIAFKELYYQQTSFDLEEIARKEKFKRERDQRLKNLSIDTNESFL